MVREAISAEGQQVVSSVDNISAARSANEVESSPTCHAIVITPHMQSISEGENEMT
jgi:hypothetical protein